MNAIKAIWTNGQILPSEPIDWPEGSELLVEPLGPVREKIGLSEDEWRDDPASIADWEACVKAIEPLEYTDEERASLAQFREEFRRYNIEAVRKQMGLGDEA